MSKTKLFHFIKLQVFHVEDVIEETGFVLEKDSEYCQKFLEEEEEITVNVTSKGGGITKYQVTFYVQKNKLVYKTIYQLCSR